MTSHSLNVLMPMIWSDVSPWLRFSLQASWWEARSHLRLLLPLRLSWLAAGSSGPHPQGSGEHLIGHCSRTLPVGSLVCCDSVSRWGPHRDLQLVSAKFWSTMKTKTKHPSVHLLKFICGWTNAGLLRSNMCVTFMTWMASFTIPGAAADKSLMMLSDQTREKSAVTMEDN